MVAIPTGIISAGFVEQYTKQRSIYNEVEHDKLKLVTSIMNEKHPWCGKYVKELVLPPQMILVVILRDGDDIIPRGETKIVDDDILVFGASNQDYDKEFELSELIIKGENGWVGKAVRDLDISRLQLLVMIKRKNKTIIPNGNTVIKNGDHIVVYNKRKD